MPVVPQKRKAKNSDHSEVEALLNSPEIKALQKDLDKLTHDGAVSFFLRFKEMANIELRDLRRARMFGLSSPSDSKWNDLLMDGNPFNIPASCWLLHKREMASCYLPSAVHTATAVQVWYALEVYGCHQMQEAHKLRLFEPIVASVLNLFHGRFVDQPEAFLLGNDSSLGCRLEHEVFFRGAQLVMIFEINSSTVDPDHVALLFKELRLAAENNEDMQELANVRVHGVLTNAREYNFYSYDPSNHTLSDDGRLLVNIESRIQSLQSTSAVTDKLFGIMLEVLIDVLHHKCHSLENRPPAIPDDSQTSAQPQPTGSKTTGRNSLSGWDTALVHAEKAMQVFRKVPSNIAELDENGDEGLRHLNTCLETIGRAMGDLLAPFKALDLATPEEVHATVERVITLEQKARIVQVNVNQAYI